MKLAVLADIHGNYTALQAVARHLETWGADFVVVDGDTVNRGPRPMECLQFVLQKQREAGWLALRGNHEEYIIAQAQPDAPQQGPLFEVFRPAYWAYRQLSSDVSALEAMSDYAFLSAPDGSAVRITHASIGQKRRGIFPFTKDETLRRRIGAPLPAVFCTAHTHIPLVRTLENTLVVNTGAAGLPFDRDWRASYAQLTWRTGAWHAEIIRLEYDRAQAAANYELSGFLQEGGPMAHLILAELLHARSQLHGWIQTYQKAVLAREITMEEAVRAHLTEQDIHYPVQAKM